MSDLIYVAFRNPDAPPENTGMTMASCRACKNKTYTLIYDEPDKHPTLRCAACLTVIGRMGWVPENTEKA